jgi:RNA polymerase sigma-70 factor, ECF subfamily
LLGGLLQISHSPYPARCPTSRLAWPEYTIGSAGAAMDNDSGQVTQLLKAMHAGDTQAAESLLPLVYAELHRLAKGYMRRERPDHTLQATALINEAYLRLVGEDIDWNSRAHFIGLAANVMRRVLVDYARAHNAEQRGGGLQRVEMQDELAISAEQLDEVEHLDEALKKLEKENPRQARVVELRYFGGLSVEQIGALLQIAPRSVKRDWALARIWLFRELRPGAKNPEAD